VTIIQDEGEIIAIDENAVVEFTTAGCGYLAVALHDITGWPLYAEYEIHRPDDVTHIWVLNDEGLAVDINGVHGNRWARTKYSGVEPGPISPVGRAEAIGSDDDFLAWARELITAFPEHFGLPTCTPRVTTSACTPRI
jgi:hypothetical protein